MEECGIQVEMLSQGASKVNISLVVPDENGTQAIQALHRYFFEKEETIVREGVAASSEVC
jgi:aspartate kinase